MEDRTIPNYDYECTDCTYITIRYISYDDRDLPQICEVCDGIAQRAWVTAPQVRTDKLSKTFVDGHKRKGYADLKIAADLEVQKLNHKPGSRKYHELNAEIQARKAIRPNNSKYNMPSTSEGSSLKKKKEEKKDD